MSREQAETLSKWLLVRDRWWFEIADKLPLKGGGMHPTPSQIYFNALFRNNALHLGMLVAVQVSFCSYKLALVTSAVPPGQNQIEVLWLRCINLEGDAPFLPDEDGLFEGIEVTRLPDPSRYTTFVQSEPGVTTREKCILHLFSAEHSLKTSLRGLRFFSILQANLVEQVLERGRRFASQKLYRRAVNSAAKDSKSRGAEPGTLRYLLQEGNATPVPAHVINAPFSELVKYTVSELSLVKESLMQREREEGVVLKGMIARQMIPQGYYVGEYVGRVFANEAEVKQHQEANRKEGARPGAYVFSVQLRDNDTRNADETTAYYIDAEDAACASWVRHVNASELQPHPQQGEDSCYELGMQNCEFVQHDHRIFLRTTQMVCYVFRIMCKKSFFLGHLSEYGGEFGGV